MKSAERVGSEDDLNFYADIDGITIVNRNCDLSMFSDDLVVRLIVEHKNFVSAQTFRGILKSNYYGIQKLNTFEVIPFFTFNRYNVFLGWNVSTNTTSKTKFVSDEDADYIMRLWLSRTFARTDEINQCRQYIPSEVMTEHGYRSLCNSAWNEFKQHFYTAFQDIQPYLPEKYREEPQIIVQIYGEKEVIKGNKISTMAGNIGKLFRLDNIQHFWITPAFNVSIPNSCGFWKRKWVEDQLELSNHKDLEFFNQLGSSSLVNASWFNDVPFFLRDVTNNSDTIYSVTKIQCYSETIYSYNNVLAKDVDLHFGTPLTNLCVLQQLEDNECINSKKVKLMLAKIREKLEDDTNWKKHQWICETLKQFRYGARFELTMFYPDEYEVDWDFIDIDFQQLFQQFKDYMGDCITRNVEESPILFISSQTISDYMLHVGKEINEYFIYFSSILKDDVGSITVSQLKLIHFLERMMCWLWRGDVKRFAYKTYKELDMDKALITYDHPVLLPDHVKGRKLLHEGCRVTVETEAAYWTSVLAVLSKESSNQLTVTVKQMLWWQLQFAKTCCKKSGFTKYFATTLVDFWFTQLKLNIWKQSQLFREICSILNFTTDEKEAARNDFEDFFKLMNQKLTCYSCFENGSFHFLCSQSKKLKLVNSLSIEQVVSEIWEMKQDFISKLILDQAILTVSNTFNIELSQFKNSVNEIVKDLFKEKKIGIFYTIEGIGFFDPFIWTSIKYTSAFAFTEASDLEAINSFDEIEETFQELDYTDLLSNVSYEKPTYRTLEVQSKENTKQRQQTEEILESRISEQSMEAIKAREALIKKINLIIKRHCYKKYPNILNQSLIPSFQELASVERLLLRTIYRLPNKKYSLKLKAVMYVIVHYYMIDAPKELIAKTRKSGEQMTNSFINDALGDRFLNVQTSSKECLRKKGLMKVTKITFTPKTPEQILDDYQNSKQKFRSKTLQQSTKPLNANDLFKIYHSDRFVQYLVSKN